MATTCQRFFHICSQIFRIKYKSLDFYGSNQYLSKRQVKSLFINFGHLIDEIKVVCPLIKNQSNAIEELIFKMINRHCTPYGEHYLKKLRFIGFTNEAIKSFVEIPPITNYLSELHLISCKIPYTFMELFNICPQVKELTIISCHSNRNYSNCRTSNSLTFYNKTNQNLTKLTVKNNSASLQTIMVMHDIHNLAPNLQDLSFLFNATSSNIENDETQNIPNLKYLTTLKIELMQNSVRRFVKLLLENNINICNLSIIRGRYENGSLYCLKKFKNLKVLEIISPYGFNYTDFTNIVKVGPQLEALHLAEIEMTITCIELKILINASPKLTLLKLDLWNHELLDKSTYLELLNIIRTRTYKNPLSIDLRDGLNYVNVPQKILQENMKELHILTND